VEERGWTAFTFGKEFAYRSMQRVRP